MTYVSPLYFGALTCNVNVNYTTQNFIFRLRQKIYKTPTFEDFALNNVEMFRWYINCRSEASDIVKDMLKNPCTVIYLIFDVFSFNVYVCLVLGTKCKN